MRYSKALVLFKKNAHKVRFYDERNNMILN